MKKIKEKKANKPKIIAFVLFSLLFLYVFAGRIFFTSLKTHYKYSISTITRIQSLSRTTNRKLIFEYSYKNKNIQGQFTFPKDSIEYYNSNIGNRYLIKMSDKNWVNKIFSTYKFYINKPVPDSIKSAPAEGWKELPEWAKKNE